jgi:hypothetical protein
MRRRDERGGTHLVFFALAFLTTFAVPPFSFPASSSSSAGAFFPFFAFFAVGFTTFSSAFEGPRFRIFAAALGEGGAGVSAAAFLARRLGGIVWRSGVVGGKQRLGDGKRGGGGKQRVTWQQKATGFRIWDNAGRRTENGYIK